MVETMIATTLDPLHEPCPCCGSVRFGKARNTPSVPPDFPYEYVAHECKACRDAVIWRRIGGSGTAWDLVENKNLIDVLLGEMNDADKETEDVEK